MVYQSGYDITVASEIMAVFCLATDLDDLQKELVILLSVIQEIKSL